ncbi:venom serine protease inhibitor-like [Anopheles funestus]|uniref:venom serine protease inhibitor-like n=1 Tax=Anopheles funestus TaxID=62324 RepID=UPI0020C72BBC|nr:venom serine protease inhibitor-like [Anopheles funestus]
MKLLVVFSVLLLAGCLEAQRCVQQKCPANEVWNCCPPCPQKYCFQPQIKPQCPAVCRPGCVCIAGYVRDNNTDKCIPAKSCGTVTRAPQPMA